MSRGRVLEEVTRRVRASLPFDPARRGWLLVGRYVLDIDSPLGVGGQGCVLPAQDRAFGGQPRAVKLVAFDAHESSNRLERFAREGQLLAEIISPHVVRVWDLGMVEQVGLVYMVTEHVEGASLEEILEALGRPLDEPESLAVACEAARGLAAMHAAGIVHRDFKPANLLWDAESGGLKVCDLGLARDLDAASLTAPDEVFGTAGYAAPEQVLAAAETGSPADVYALGAALYRMLTGHEPVSGSNRREMLIKAARGELDDLEAGMTASGVRAETQDAVTLFLSEDPAERPADALAAHEILNALLDSHAGAQAARELPSLRGLARSPALGELRLRRIESLSGSRLSAPDATSSADAATRATVTWSRTMAAARATDAPLSPDPREPGAQHEILDARATDDRARSETVQWQQWRASAPAGSRAGNLPHARASFHGRETEFARLEELIGSAGARLVTLSGPGGMGKTTLSVEAARRLAPGFAGGAWFVALATTRDAAGVAGAVATALGVPLSPRDEPIEAVANVLELREPMLIVLDNFEQVVDAAAMTVGVWQERCPQVHFLVTSRACLGLVGEEELVLPPLDRAVATQLFLERARSVKPGFASTAGEIELVSRIVEDLEGMPLALELAAARARIMKPAQMLERLSRKLELLAAGGKGADQRHRTLRAAIQWSIDLLEDWERSAFLQASVFRGGFFLELAEEVIDLDAFPDSPPVMDAMQSLREQSLLRELDTPHGLRLDQYVVIREHADELARREFDRTVHTELERRHGEAVLRLLEGWNARIQSKDAREALDHIDIELDNAFAAEERALDRGEIDLAAGILVAAAGTLAIRGHPQQRGPRLEAVHEEQSELLTDTGAASTHSLELAVMVTAELARACIDTGRWDRAAELVPRAVDIAGERLPGTRAQAYALELAGDLARVRGELDQALEKYEEARRIYAELRHMGKVGGATGRRGAVLWSRGDLEGALEAYSEAEEFLEAAGHQLGLAMLANNRGIVERKLGHHREAMDTLAEAEQHFREFDNRPGIATCLLNRGNVAQDLGDFAAALADYAEAESVFRELGQKSGVALVVGNRGTALWILGEREAALTCFKESEQLARQLGEKLRVALQVGNRGRCLFDLGHSEEAYEALVEALALYDEAGVAGSQSFGVLAALAAVEEELGHAEQALVHARRALEAFDSASIDESRRDLVRAFEEVRRIAGAS